MKTTYYTIIRFLILSINSLINDSLFDCSKDYQRSSHTLALIERSSVYLNQSSNIRDL